MKKNIYITGSHGLVASRFVELALKDFNLITPEIGELDITDGKAVFDYFKDKDVSSIINFAAYTDVSSAEGERDDKNGACWKVNTEAVSNLIDLSREKNAHLIHISTDMVFPGSKEYPGPYSESQGPETSSEKLTWYGYTKAQAEELVKNKQGNRATILRLIYPVRSTFPGKLDYLRKPLMLYDQGKLYPMFTDQQISISFIDEICDALNVIIKGGVRGVFHASSKDTTNPFEIVSYLIEKARGVKGAVKPLLLDDFIKTTNNSVRYPKYGGLKVEETEKTLGIKYGSWKQIIDILIEQGVGGS